ncbi:MAG: D-alanyl-D-alanine carboxypeptidase [Deltaproteobacteria bacterium]|nr:D-alanyl-D-alanine carboxypeptidase [Deltaproteobacteria bacterium]
MKKNYRCIFFFLLIAACITVPAQAAGKQTPTKTGSQALSKDPYLGAILIDAASGKVLFEDNPDVQASPASIIKLMDLLIVLEYAQNKAISLDDTVIITAEAAKMGGSQVYLKENEQFTVEELLYALMVQSANDAAVAIALHVAGTKDAFVDLMNKKAREIGMTNTIFHSVHGLPPGKGQQADISTPRDIARLCQELLKWDALRYTSVKERPFRVDSAEPFIMRNHNHLLGNFEGCDGFKTGYYRVAGFSIAATAARKNQRAIAVVLGSENRLVRDAKAKDLLARGLTELIRTAPPVAPPPAPAVQDVAEPKKEEVPKADEKDVIEISTRMLKVVGISIGIVFLIVVVALLATRKGKKKKAFLNG